MHIVNKLSIYCIALSTLSFSCTAPSKLFKDKQSLDDTIHAFVTLGKNVGDPAVKVGLPFMYLYNAGSKTYAQTPEDFLAAFGAYAAYEEFKTLTGVQPTIPHVDATCYAQEPNKQKAAEALNVCIDLANKGIDLAMPCIIVWLLKTAGKALD